MVRFLLMLALLAIAGKTQAQDSIHATMLQDIVINTSGSRMYPLQVSDSIFQLPVSVAAFLPAPIIYAMRQ